MSDEFKRFSIDTYLVYHTIDLFQEIEGNSSIPRIGKQRLSPMHKNDKFKLRRCKKQKTE